MSHQLTFADSEFSTKRRQTRKEIFLSRMEQILPWQNMTAVIEPFYPKAGNGRRPYPLETMLRIHCMQHWYNLSDGAMEDALYEIASMRLFARLSLDSALPDRTTIMNFRHLLERKTAVPPSKRAHTGKVAVKESNQRWCSDGFEFRCDNGEKLRVTFALDCCDREALHWAVTTGGFNSETVQDVMLGAVERRFGNDLPSSPVEWLTDNGSCYRANETRQFARMLGLEPKNTAVRSPESNGIAESFVKTIKRDYISIMPKPDGLTAAKNLAEAFEHYNEWHPHSALGYRSPREYLRQQASNGLSDNRCLEI